MSERVAPQYCPYCGDEGLWPHGERHGAWECRACTRAFTVAFLGLVPAGGVASPVVPAAGPAAGVEGGSGGSRREADR